MDLLLQIALPILVTLAALIGIAVWKRYFGREVLAICAALLVAGGTLMTLHLTDDSLSLSDSETLSAVDTVSLTLAQEYLSGGQTQAALDVLNELSTVNGNNQDVQTTLARATFLSGNYTVAAQLYQTLDEEVNQELAYALALDVSSQKNDNALIAYLEKNGIDPGQYDLKKVDTTQVSVDEANEYVLAQVREDLQEAQDSAGNADLIQAVQAATQVNLRFDNRQQPEDGEVDWQSQVDLLDQYMDKHEVLNKNSYLRIARLKGFVLGGDYRQIAASADAYAGTEELLLLTELYAGGKVQEQDFPENCLNIDKNLSQEILDNGLAELEAVKDTLTETQYQRYQEKLDNLKIQIEKPALGALRYNLQWQAEEGDAPSRSKCYLALAKLEKYCGNPALAEGYIADALGTAADSDDENYRQPMTQMCRVVSGTSKAEEIKQLADCVDEAVNHSLPVFLTAAEADQYYRTPEQLGESVDNLLPGTDLGNAWVDEGESEQTGEQAQPEQSFNDYMNDTVNQSTASINIGAINKDEFPIVKARVQIQSSEWTTLEEIQEHLKVYDCGSEITNFKLEKLEFSQSNIILLCDISGSMSGSEDSLRRAIVTFADDMGDGEAVCVIGFSGDIVFQEPFSTDPEEVKKAQDKINANGGTALYNSLIYSGTVHNNDINANNIIIAMTDGQDGNNVGDGTMYNEIGRMVTDKNITVYTLGLGSGVNVEYLEKIAKFGNGSFLYVENDEKLQSFYSFIHGQLSNQYILTYEARNKTLNERKLELSLEDELGGAEKTYYLVDPVYTDEGSDGYDPFVAQDAKLSVSGLETKFLYTSSKNQTVNLRGTGFADGDDVEVRISGNLKYDLQATYVNPTTYSITIPPEVSVGTYDLTVTIRGESVTLEKEFSMAVQGTEKNFRFGAYNFTALNSYKNEQGETVLSGNVVMNGWLRFKGDVSFAEYQDRTKVRMTDNSGCYMAYSTSTAQGLAKRLAETGISIPVPALGSLYLYSDPYEAGKYDDFPVEKSTRLNPLNLKCFVVENYGVSVYPDMLRVMGFNIQTPDFPLKDQLLRGLDIDDAPFESLDAETELLLSNSQIGFKGKFKLELNDVEDFSMISFPLALKELEISADTLSDDYNLDTEVQFKAFLDKKKNINDAFKGLNGFTFGLGWKGGRFDRLALGTKGTEVTVLQTPVPIAVKDFGIEVKDFSQYTDDQNILEKLLDTTVSATFEVEVADLTNYLPKVKKFIDKDNDVPVASLENCKLSVKLSELRFSFDADLKLMTVLDMGQCHIAAGNIDYTNALVGFYNRNVFGLQAKLTVGPSIKTTNIDLKAQITAEVVVGVPYIGVWGNGTVDFEIGWWILSKEWEVSGDVLLALYENSAGNTQASLIVRGVNSKGKLGGFHAYITRATGFDVYKYK